MIFNVNQNRFKTNFYLSANFHTNEQELFMTALKILKLDPGHAFSRDGRAMSADNRPNDYISVLDQYEFEHVDMSSYNVLLITDFIDQEYLYAQRDKIACFLNAGNIVISCAHIFRPWLPGVNLFMPKEIRSYKDYSVITEASSAIFGGVKQEELTVRKGVAGFFARGYHPVHRDDVEVHIRFTDGTPITYVDRTTTNGTIFVHTSRDIFTYKTGDNTSQLVAPRMYEWLKQELVMKGDAS